MSRRAKFLRNIGIGLTALIVVLVISTGLLVQTDWFRNYVKQKIVTVTEEGTGGKVEIGSFAFDWRHLRAVVTDFVIHGNEPAGVDPFVRVRRVQVDLRLFTSLKRPFDISYLGVERPEANIIVFADGRTNVPTPKKQKKSDTTALETVVNLAVGHFELTNGLLTLNSRKQPLYVRGRNLRAQLWYNLPRQGYRGQFSIQPLYTISGRNTPVSITVSLPVVLERDRIAFDNATITTPASHLTIDGSLENLRNPKTSARINGHLALADLKNLGNLPLALNDGNVPARVEIAANATMAENIIQVEGLQMGIGASNIEASGTLKDPQGNRALEFKARLAVGELGRLAKVAARPEGVVVVNGTAQLDVHNNYRVIGNIQAKDLSLQQGSQRIRNITLASAINLDPHRLDLKGLRLAAFGGEFAGDVSLTDFARYQVAGKLRNLDLQNVFRVFGQNRLPYDGIVSGPVQAGGDLKAPGAKSITASARLAISPGRRGIPLSGRLYADYSGATDNISISNSYLALPQTRLNLSGSVNQRLNLELRTRDLNDFLAATRTSGKPAITLNGGEATFIGAVTGGLNSPHLAGHLAVHRFSVQGRQFDALTADLAAAKTRVSVRNGNLHRSLMQAQFAAAVGLVNWSPKPAQPLSASATVRNGDFADIMVLAGQSSDGYSGAVTADMNVGGTVGDPRGLANLQVASGTLVGEAFDRIQVQVKLADQMIAIPTASIVAGSAHVNLTAEFEHPRETFTTGRVHVHVESNQVNLAQFRILQKERPNSAGLLQVKADVTGSLAQVKTANNAKSEFLLTSVNADVSARKLQFEGRNYGDFSVKARTTGQRLDYNVSSDFAGSDIRASGNTQLIRGYPTKADANVSNLPVERLLVLARRTEIPARGNLSATAHFMGTMENPQGHMDLELAKAVLYGEPIDSVRGRIHYLPKSIDVPRVEIVSGLASVNLSARYDHPAGDLRTGDLQFRLNTDGIELARIRNIQDIRPGLGGTLQVAAHGAATVREASPKILFRELNADIEAQRITSQGKNFGSLAFKANTSGDRLKFSLDSDLAGAAIRGRGDAQLSEKYPLDAQLTFNQVSWTRLQPLIGPRAGQSPAFDAVADGQVSVSGPAADAEQLRASLRVSKLQVRTIPEPGSLDKPLLFQNQEVIAARLDQGVMHIESAHLTGPETDINATGTASLLEPQRLDVKLNAKTNLSLLQNMSRSIFSSGNIVLATVVRGTIDKPLVNGRLELHKASLNYADFPNGISNADGVVLFNGNTARIEKITAESGGGKISLTGFANMDDTLRFGLRANAANMRVRVQQGVSIVTSADLNLTGAMQSSQVSGTLTIGQVTYAPQSDIGSILTRSAPPVQTPPKPSPLLDNMKLDIAVRTSSSTAIQASPRAESATRCRSAYSWKGLATSSVGTSVNYRRGTHVFWLHLQRQLWNDLLLQSCSY